MLHPSFVHLRLHSEYSIADGIVRPDEAVTAAGADATSVAGGTAGWLESGRRVDTGL